VWPRTVLDAMWARRPLLADAGLLLDRLGFTTPIAGAVDAAVGHDIGVGVAVINHSPVTPPSLLNGDVRQPARREVVGLRVVEVRERLRGDVR